MNRSRNSLTFPSATICLRRKLALSVLPAPLSPLTTITCERHKKSKWVNFVLDHDFASNGLLHPLHIYRRSSVTPVLEWTAHLIPALMEHRVEGAVSDGEDVGRVVRAVFVAVARRNLEKIRK